MKHAASKFAPVCLALAAGMASAQCDPSWDTTIGNPGVTGTGYIGPMTIWDDGNGAALYAGGSANGIGASGINGLGKYDFATETWSNLGSGIISGGTNIFITRILPWDDGTGEKLYVAGQFGGAGGVPDTNSLAAWDGTQWISLGAGFTQTMSRVTYDMLPLDLGSGEKLYMVGNWSEIGGTPVGTGLAVYDPAHGGSFAPWGNGIGIAGGFSPFVNSMILWDDGSGPAVYINGRFDSVDGVSATNVARFNITTGQWESFGQPLVPTSIVNNNTSWVIFDDGDGEALYLGGQQFRIGGSGQVFNVAKWDGTSWTGVGQFTSGRVTDLAVFDDGSGPALYATGTAFFEVEYFAKLVNNQWVPALGGVFGPPTNGNFPSAFGLLAWEDKLFVGGNFTRVGGDLLTSRGIAAIQGCATPSCPPDLNGDGVIDADDFFLFLQLFADGDTRADFNNDGVIDADDFFAFLNAFATGC